MADEEEDDYLNMTFEEPTKKETSLQRTARLKKESAERGKILSKAERSQKEREKREQALATELDSSNKGAQMMAKMGFKGGALGKTEDARTRPIEVNLKDDRGGIGMESEKKRKIREAAEEMDIKEKRVKLTAEEYRERNRLEGLEKRHEGQMWSAMRVLDGFETDGDPQGPPMEGDKDEKANKTGTSHLPLRSVNVLRRPLVKSRMEKERARRMRNDMAQSLSRHKDYIDDPNMNDDDKLAFGKEVEEDLEEEDPELAEFEALSVEERLEKLLTHLREKYFYCFWCKHRYENEAMDGCPGLSEDEHG